MSEKPRRQLIVQPDSDIPPEIGRGLWMLDDARQRTQVALGTLDPASLDWLPDWALHSVGTLLYHIALVELDWLHVEVLEHVNDEPFPDDMAALFPYPMRSNNALTPIVGISLDEHRQRLAATRQRLHDVYRAMSLDDFRRPRALPDYDVSPEWVLHHLCQHEAEHRSEIAALRTQFKSKSEN